MLIFKVCDAAQWSAAKAQGLFEGAPIDLADGFIHFSAASQLPETLRKHFAGKTDQVLVAVDPERLGSALNWEVSRGGKRFPHLYGPLDPAMIAFERALPAIPVDGGLDLAETIDARPSAFERFAMAALRALPAERAHLIALRAVQHDRGPRPVVPAVDPALSTRVAGLNFPNPLGLAAGFDKNAEAIDGLFRYGFGFVEIGAVTPRPQIGNPRPRVFRLTEDRAVINRMGFNNDGLDAIHPRLRYRRARGIVGANIGANKDSTDRAQDYATVARALAMDVDFLTVNVSSPNTERLRDLQGPEALIALLRGVLAARDETGATTPVFVKIAPDMDEEALAAVAQAALDAGVNGIVATNTTIGLRDAVRDPARLETGGLSGAPLFERSTEVLRFLRRQLRGQIALIGVGGIGNAAQAYEKILAGADLIQLYSALVYEGPNLAGRLLDGLSERLRIDGYASIADAVGAAAD